MLITFTNVESAVSLRPTSGLLNYNLTSYLGSALERGSVNLEFQNLYPAKMNISTVGVSPNLWDKSKTANYTLVFSPVGFEVN